MKCLDNSTRGMRVRYDLRGGGMATDMAVEFHERNRFVEPGCRRASCVVVVFDGMRMSIRHG